MSDEIIFEVREDEADGGYAASAQAVKEARAEYARGEVKKGTAADLMKDLSDN